MSDPRERHLGASALRRELSARNLQRASAFPHEATFGETPSVIYSGHRDGAHGNFLDASFRRIQARPDWLLRLDKAYTASRRVPRSADRRRGELECANSSDALLMNIFCYPGVLRRPGICALLGIDSGLQPEFGHRPMIPFANGGVDRTEVDMRLGNSLFEAKLTETGFQQSRSSLLERYRDWHEVFEGESLPRLGERYESYQLLRGVLSAAAVPGNRFIVLCDRRRTDLTECWFRVLRSVPSWELRSRLSLLTWQELSVHVPSVVQEFLDEKYGIVPGT